MHGATAAEALFKAAAAVFQHAFFLTKTLRSWPSNFLCGKEVVVLRPGVVAHEDLDSFLVVCNSGVLSDLFPSRCPTGSAVRQAPSSRLVPKLWGALVFFTLPFPPPSIAPFRRGTGWNS